MSSYTVRSQVELDAALESAKADSWAVIDIRSDRGVWLKLATVPRSATVTASGSATVTASGSATVTAYGSATVTASSKVAIHLFDARVQVSGGVVIDVSKEVIDPSEWCDYHGVEVSAAGVATLYKAVDASYLSGWGTSYSPGTKPSAPDWRDNHECGGGLHFSPSPVQALTYNAEATRFLAVGVQVSDLRPIPGGTAKCKAPRVVRACAEVDIDGKPVADEAMAS